VAARSRFALEVAKVCVDAIGGDRVGIRISPYGVFNEMPHYPEIDETYLALAKKLGEIGLVYLHVVDHSSMGAPALPDDLKPKLREAFGGTFILSGGYDFDRANGDLAAENGNLVAFARLFLANPDLLDRFAKDAELNEPRPDYFYSPGAEGYSDYPTLGGVTPDRPLDLPSYDGHQSRHCHHSVPISRTISGQLRIQNRSAPSLLSLPR
jgi:N-ethylmaleimide reductase